MSVKEVAAFVERANRDGVPRWAVRKMCLNRSYAPSRSTETAEDAANESYTRALACELKTEGYFLNEKHFRAWVTRTAINYVNDAGRRASREDGSELIGLMLDKKTHGDQFGAVRTCIDGLTGAGQLTISMTVEGATLLEIADGLQRDFPDTIVKPDEAARLKLPPTPTARVLRAKRVRDRALADLVDCLERNGLNPYQPAP
jgi:DNA-directed RNA polymerase specialized sigma24 family protein